MSTNHTSLTDNELFILSIVIDNLLGLVVDQLAVDLNLQFSLEQMEMDYQENVRLVEQREPLLMETKLYAIQQIIHMASQWWLQTRYSLEMAIGVEHDRCCELEMRLRRMTYNQ